MPLMKSGALPTSCQGGQQRGDVSLFAQANLKRSVMLLAGRLSCVKIQSGVCRLYDLLVIDRERDCRKGMDQCELRLQRHEPPAL